jgi:hypothetical protein
MCYESLNHLIYVMLVKKVDTVVHMLLLSAIPQISLKRKIMYLIRKDANTLIILQATSIYTYLPLLVGLLLLITSVTTDLIGIFR